MLVFGIWLNSRSLRGGAIGGQVSASGADKLSLCNSGMVFKLYYATPAQTCSTTKMPNLPTQHLICGIASLLRCPNYRNHSKKSIWLTNLFLQWTSENSKTSLPLCNTVIERSKDLLDGFACFGCNAYLELDSFSCHKVQVKHDLFDTRRLQSSSPIVFQNAPENKQTNSKACNPLRAAAGPPLQTGFPISTTFTYLKTDNLYISSQYHFKVCFIIVCCLIFIRQKNCHESFADQEIFHRRCLAYIRKK